MGNGYRPDRTPEAQAAALARQYQQQFDASATAPIPGYGNMPVPSAPMGGAGPPQGGLLGGSFPVGWGGPQQQIPRPQAMPPPMPGPYGQQAMRMAGLLSGPVESMPAAGNGLLGGGRVGFRLPYGGK